MAISQPAVIADVWSARATTVAGQWARQATLVVGAAAFVGLAAQIENLRDTGEKVQ